MRGFLDRRDAGRQLGARVALDRSLRDAVVVGLPRGGLPVAAEVAAALAAPLDVLVVRKVGLAYQPEVAMGAIGEDGIVVEEEDVVRAAAVSARDFAAAAARERIELERRVRRYRGGRDLVSLAGEAVVIVDDGAATGATARAACAVARAAGAARVVVAVPVASGEAVRRLRRDGEDVVSLIVAEGPFAVGRWYEQFDQTSDEEVVACLAVARRRGDRDARADPATTEPFGSSGFASDIAGGAT